MDLNIKILKYFMIENKILKKYCLWGSIIREFSFFTGALESNSHRKEGMIDLLPSYIVITKILQPIYLRNMVCCGYTWSDNNVRELATVCLP